ncbi:MAG: glycerol-3-phosphate 1-O-acyltransferase PlsY [Alphaproteobacteria bacterium]|nr:glycerol-3-phosphate 1-O-acyltransferase PlsY [Alphaproteobacteria bacterium]
MIPALAFLFLTYLAAAVPFGLVLTMLYGGEADIRQEGSGNIGATNVVRVYGWAMAAPVLALDVGKGLLPVLLARVAFPDLGTWWLGLTALVAFLGHVYPVYLAFHGGKGVATGAGAMLGLAPAPTAGAAVVWGLVLVVTGRSSLASLTATAALVGLALLLQPDALGVATVLALGILQSHVGNIRRLIAGDEQAILRPVRWGRSDRSAAPDPAEVLAMGPAGTAAPEAWRTTTDDASSPESP